MLYRFFIYENDFIDCTKPGVLSAEGQDQPIPRSKHPVCLYS